MTIDRDLLAKEAKRLRDDIFLQEVIKVVSVQAMRDLATVKPDDITQIIALQQRVRFCSDLWSELESMINSGQAKQPKTVI